MNLKTIASLLIFFVSMVNLPVLQAQDLEVPDEILYELYTETFNSIGSESIPISFKIVYPKNYDETKSYPVFLGIAGGNQNDEIVTYCYAAWFRSNQFKDYFTILPIAPDGENLRDASPTQVRSIIATIKRNFNLTKSGWIMGGTSNGGVAAFNFISSSPALFDGIIVAPGRIPRKIRINDKWRHLKVVIAYGEEDSDDWKRAVNATSEKLKGMVSFVKVIPLAGQGHLLPIDYDFEVVYDAYFEEQE